MVYHDGNGTYPTIDDYVYADSLAVNKFNGFNDIWKVVGSGNWIRILYDGEVPELGNCQ